MIRLLNNLLCYITGLTIGMLVVKTNILVWFLSVPTLSLLIYLDQKDQAFWKRVHEVEKEFEKVLGKTEKD